MAIQPLKVVRDECGMWCHPDLPEWDEGTLSSVPDEWALDNCGAFHIEYFEHSASEELIKSWFEDGSTDCTDWMPNCEITDSFLLSIHDTEDGPVALYFVPTSKKD